MGRRRGRRSAIASSAVIACAAASAAIRALTLGGSGAESFALGGSVSTNLLRNSIRAYLTDSATVTARRRVGITATHKARIHCRDSRDPASTQPVWGSRQDPRNPLHAATP